MNLHELIKELAGKDEEYLQNLQTLLLVMDEQELKELLLEAKKTGKKLIPTYPIGITRGNSEPNGAKLE